MNTDETLQIDSTGLQQSLALAELLGSKLRGGEVIELVSDLGGGKTTFTKGLAKGIGSSDTVTSPTFTLNNVYRGPKLTMYHFDFYRLAEAGIMNEELVEVLGDPTAVTVVEWGDIVQNVLPANKLTIQIKATGDTSRRYNLNAPLDLNYLMEGLSI